jgi:DNA-binding NarL/FixJ family response regulator
MRNTRVLYVEDDPALRSIMTTLLNKQPGINISGHADNSKSALSLARDQEFDVALLDIALGTESANGIELGLQLRSMQPHIGIVIYSQHAESTFPAARNTRILEGWSTVQKSASIDIPYLVDVLKSTARGLSIIDPKLSTTQREDETTPSSLNQLSLRQQEVMALLIEGLDVPHIAKKLGLSAVTIRQELSRIYKILVPEPAPGTDLRTTAVLRYLRQSRNYAWGNAE